MLILPKTWFMMSALLLVLESCNQNNVFDILCQEYIEDSIKTNAVQYLQRYSTYHYGVKRTIKDIETVRAIQKLGMSDDDYSRLLDSAGIEFVEDRPIMDDEALTADFLRENVELAFDSWKRPWAKEVSFEDFCKYILPYRNSDEELHHWRKFFKDKYEGMILDSLGTTSDIRQVSEFLLNQLRKEIEYGPRTGKLTQKPLTVDEMQTLHWMGCLGCAHYVTLAMRACGIPCQMITAFWRFTECPHTSVMIPAVGFNSRAFRIGIGDKETLLMGEPKDTMATLATWGTCYEVNEELAEMLDDFKQGGMKDEAKRLMALPLTREDRTADMCTVYKDLWFPVPDSLQEMKHLFLCRFYQWKWLPVRAGTIEGGSVHFRNASIRQLYRLGVASADSVNTFGDIFTLAGDSGRVLSRVKDSVRPYNQQGDTVIYKFAYNCDSTETRLSREIKHWYWSKEKKWKSITPDATLWGFNPETGDYKIFNETMRGTYKPVFHLVEIKMPKWTLFTSVDLQRPVGFLVVDDKFGYVMEF